MNVNEIQIGGQHYKADIQHWDYVIRALQGRYLEGNITKYVTRHRKKNGLQDLQKAAHYLDKLRQEHQDGRVPSMRDLNLARKPFAASALTAAFCAENGLNTAEARVVATLVNWVSEVDLDRVREAIIELMVEAQNEARRMEAIKAGVPVNNGAEPSGSYINQG